MTSIVLNPDTDISHDLTTTQQPEPLPQDTTQQEEQPEPTQSDIDIPIDEVYNTIIEDELQNFEIVESEEEETTPQQQQTVEINSKKDQKIRDLLESLIMFGLFIATYGYDIEEKQKAVMEFCKENKDLIDQLILNLERSIAQMPMIYEQLKKLNGWSFIFQLIALFMAFDSFMKNWQKSETKTNKEISEKSENKKEDDVNDFSTTTEDTKPARLSVF